MTRRRRAPRATLEPVGEFGPPHQHAASRRRFGTGRIEVVDAPDAGEGADPNRVIRRARVADPLRYCVKAGMPYRCFLAAERMRADIEQAAALRGLGSQLRPRVVVGPPAGADMPLGALAAQRRVAAAWQAIGLALSGVVQWCVAPQIHDEGGRRFGTLDAYAMRARIRRQEAGEMLRRALTRLADHYDLGDPEPPTGFA